jgi:MATE family multidrug resistance protein
MPTATRAELKAILRLAGPLIAAQLAHVMMVFTDTVMMGLLGPAWLAAGLARRAIRSCRFSASAL